MLLARKPSKANFVSKQNRLPGGHCQNDKNLTTPHSGAGISTTTFPLVPFINFFPLALWVSHDGDVGTSERCNLVSKGPAKKHSCWSRLTLEAQPRPRILVLLRAGHIISKKTLHPCPSAICKRELLLAASPDKARDGLARRVQALGRFGLVGCELSNPSQPDTLFLR